MHTYMSDVNKMLKNRYLPVYHDRFCNSIVKNLLLHYANTQQ